MKNPYTQRKHHSTILAILSGVDHYVVKFEPPGDNIFTIERITWMADGLGIVLPTETWLTVHQRYDPPPLGATYIDGLKYFKMNVQSTPYNNNNEELNLSLPGGTPIYVRFRTANAGVTMLQMLIIYREERIDSFGNTRGGE